MYNICIKNEVIIISHFFYRFPFAFNYILKTSSHVLFTNIFNYDTPCMETTFVIKTFTKATR